jgi:integrase
MSAKKRSVVRRGNSHLTVYPYGEGWRFCWREREGEPWRYVTRTTKKAAEEAAFEKLGEIDAGGLVWSGLDPAARRYLQEVHRLSTEADRPAVLGFLASRRKSAEIVASVERFMDFKEAQKGGATRHLSNVRRDLEALAKAFAGRSVTDVTDGDLTAWWQARVGERSGKTRNECRGNLVAFWNWCVRDGIFPKEVTPAEKLPRVDLEPCERRVLTSGEVLAVLAKVGVEWRPWVVLGAFCGLRPEEISPVMGKVKTRRGKRGLRCEEIDWQFNVIRLPAEVSKINTPRHVPLLPAARAWLEWAGIRPGMVGAVCGVNPTEAGETLRLGKVVFKDGWPQDALRHSYGSMRNAVLRNLPQVAEEMGTSETMLRRHYHNPRTSEEGAEWFGLRPGMIRFDPISRGLDSGAQGVARAAGA